MNHPEDLLAAFVDGTATLQERATVEAHVTFCSACRREIEMARSALAALQGLPDLEAPPLDLGSLAARPTAVAATTASTAPGAVVPSGPAAEEPGHPIEPVGVGPGRYKPAQGPGRAGHRRTPPRWQVRVVQGALAAAAVAVAVGVFANLGGNSKLTSTFIWSMFQTTTGTAAPSERRLAISWDFGTGMGCRISTRGLPVTAWLL